MLEAGEESLGGKIHHQLQVYFLGGHANKEANITLDDDWLMGVALLQKEGTGEVCSNMSEVWSWSESIRWNLFHKLLRSPGIDLPTGYIIL